MRFSLKPALCFSLLFIFTLHAFGQQNDSTGYVSEPYLSFKLTPGMVIPLASSSVLFKPGGGVALTGEYQLLPFL